MNYLSNICKNQMIVGQTADSKKAEFQLREYYKFSFGHNTFCFKWHKKVWHKWHIQINALIEIFMFFLKLKLRPEMIFAPFQPLSRFLLDQNFIYFCTWCASYADHQKNYRYPRTLLECGIAHSILVEKPCLFFREGKKISITSSNIGHGAAAF